VVLDFGAGGLLLLIHADKTGTNNSEAINAFILTSSMDNSRRVASPAAAALDVVCVRDRASGNVLQWRRHALADHTPEYENDAVNGAPGFATARRS
jgi:hypothetical protein